jgi:hypothetical protein
MGVVFPEGNNPLRVNNSDAYNPLKAITVLLYRTTDQGLGIRIFKQNMCLITFDKFLTNVKLFHVYIKVHNTTSDIGHKPAISNIFNRFKMYV